MSSVTSVLVQVSSGTRDEYLLKVISVVFLCVCIIGLSLCSIERNEKTITEIGPYSDSSLLRPLPMLNTSSLMYLCGCVVRSQAQS